MRSDIEIMFLIKSLVTHLALETIHIIMFRHVVFHLQGSRKPFTTKLASIFQSHVSSHVDFVMFFSKETLSANFAMKLEISCVECIMSDQTVLSSKYFRTTVAGKYSFLSSSSFDIHSLLFR